MNQFEKYPADCVCIEQIQHKIPFEIPTDNSIDDVNSTSLGNMYAIYKLGLESEKKKLKNI